MNIEHILVCIFILCGRVRIEEASAGNDVASVPFFASCIALIDGVLSPCLRLELLALVTIRALGVLYRRIEGGHA